MTEQLSVLRHLFSLYQILITSQLDITLSFYLTLVVNSLKSATWNLSIIFGKGNGLGEDN